MEREQPSRTGQRRAGGGALEPPASGPGAADAVSAPGAEGLRRAGDRLQRLYEGSGRPDRAVAAGADGDARYRRIRPQRQPRVLAAALRDQRGIHRRRRPFASGARWQVRRPKGGRRLRRTEIGFGRSDNREYLRRHFEINAESIAAAALSRLARDGRFDAQKAVAAFAELGVDTEKIDAARA